VSNTNKCLISSSVYSLEGEQNRTNMPVNRGCRTNQRFHRSSSCLLPVRLSERCQASPACRSQCSTRLTRHVVRAAYIASYFRFCSFRYVRWWHYCVHCTALHCMFCTALHCTALRCTALHRTALRSALQSTLQGPVGKVIQWNPVLLPPCTALHCTALHCTALHPPPSIR
jgi:hypothetical protein